MALPIAHHLQRSGRSLSSPIFCNTLNHAIRSFGSAVESSSSSELKSTEQQPTTKYTEVSDTEGAAGFPRVNARYKPVEHQPLDQLPDRRRMPGASPSHWEANWNEADLQRANEQHVMLTWGPSQPAKELPKIVRSEGVYVYDKAGKRYLDWTSQAICTNLGHTMPEPISAAVNRQMETLPYLYSGMGMCPVRPRLSKLLAELTPGDITGFLFPCGGSEANEAAIRMARRYTGREKILTQYRSYHGGSAHALGATGDFRRSFTESGVSGFVKIFNPQPWGFSWGKTDAEATKLCLQALEEQILLEGPTSIAAIMLESIVGAGGVLVPPDGYMEGVRALCNKYDILMILDEVMAGFGRTGELWAFEHFEGVVPDIVTSAKGLTGAFLPMSVVGFREHLKQFFLNQPLGWGATYHAHPVTMACAYESVKYIVAHQLPQRAKTLQYVMLEEIDQIVKKHISVKQGRAIGLFGCLDLQDSTGRSIQSLSGPSPPHVQDFRKALRRNGLMALFRPPLLHCCPPLIITERELRDGFRRLSISLSQLDAAIAGKRK